MKILAAFKEKFKMVLTGTNRTPLLEETAEEHRCINCGTEFRGNFCPQCGQSCKTERLTVLATLRNLLFFFSKFDDKFWHTIANLFYRPGVMIRDYLQGRRVGYVRPVQMLVCMITIYVILCHMLFPATDVRAEFINLQGFDPEEHLNGIWLACYNTIEFMMNNPVASSLGGIFVSVLPFWLCFRLTKEGKMLNVAEHFYALVFISCQMMFVSFLALPVYLIVGSSPESSNIMLLLAFNVWVYHQLVRAGWWRTIGIVVLAYFLILVEVMLVLAVVLTALCLGGVIPK